MAEPPIISVTSAFDPAGVFDRNDPYLEIVWLPIVGPASVAIIRHLDRWLDGQPSARLPATELAAHCGLSLGTGRHSTLGRTLARITDFGLGRFVYDEWTLRLPAKVLPLSTRLTNRLPPAALAYHLATTQADRSPRHRVS